MCVIAKYLFAFHPFQRIDYPYRNSGEIRLKKRVSHYKFFTDARTLLFFLECPLTAASEEVQSNVLITTVPLPIWLYSTGQMNQQREKE